jgi:phage terminase Nu1 subunit (DNA packaging protein)
MAQALTVDQIAKVLLIDPRRVQQLTKEGWIPKAERGQYDLLPSVQGYIRSLQHSVQRRGPQELARELDEAELAIKKARQEKLELDNAQARGELLPRDVEAGWMAILAIIKNQLLNLPSAMAPLVVDLMTVAEVEASLKTRIYDTLNELSSIHPVVTEPETGAGQPGPTPNPDRESMG